MQLCCWGGALLSWHARTHSHTCTNMTYRRTQTCCTHTRTHTHNSLSPVDSFWSSRVRRSCCCCRMPAAPGSRAPRTPLAIDARSERAHAPSRPATRRARTQTRLLDTRALARARVRESSSRRAHSSRRPELRATSQVARVVRACCAFLWYSVFCVLGSVCVSRVRTKSARQPTEPANRVRACVRDCRIRQSRGGVTPECASASVSISI